MLKKKSTKEKNWDIAFYGMDNTPIEKAYVEYRDGEKFKCKRIEAIEDENVKNKVKKALWDILNFFGNKTNKLCVGSTKNPDIPEKDYTLWSFYDNKQCFGNVVGTIRTTFKKGKKLKSTAENKNSEVSSTENKNSKTSSTENESSETPPAENKSSETYNNLNIIINRIYKEFSEVKVKLEIVSRFDNFNKKNPEKTKLYFLADLLMHGKNLQFDANNVDFNYESLFDFYMIWLLIDKFKSAMLKGFFKQYQRFEKNDDRIKGSIDIARHIRLNMGMNNGKIAYSYRENTIDNMMNHLLLSAFDYVKEKYPYIAEKNIGLDIAQELNHLKYEIGYPKYDRRTIITKNSIPISHPFFNEYRELQEICIKIMRDEGVSPFVSETENVEGILYYVPDLWEEYLEEYMQKGLKNLNNIIEQEERHINMTSQEDIYVMVMENEPNKGHKTRPDFVFRYGNDTNKSAENDSGLLILDAKFKPSWKYALHGELKSNLLGDYDKCIRDMVSINAFSCGVVFPVSDEDKIESSVISHRFSKYNRVGFFYTLPVTIPPVEDEERFTEWRKKMTECMDDLLTDNEKILYYEMQRKIEIDKALKKIKKMPALEFDILNESE